MSNPESLNECANTDKEIWREREDDYYADSIHVTQSGDIGVCCGGHCIVKPVREWHKLAARGNHQQPLMDHLDKMTRADFEAIRTGAEK